MEVLGARATQLIKEYDSKCNDWYPKQTNAFELYVQANSDWKKINVSNLTYKNNWHETWKDMPKAAIDFLKELPEFDAQIFKEITGIDVTKKEDKKIEAAIKLLEEKGKLKDGKIII